MHRIMHLHLDIEGAIENAEMYVGAIEADGKTLATVKEVKEFLRGQLDLGRRVLPYGDCDNFDYQTGCMGHSAEQKCTDE